MNYISENDSKTWAIFAGKEPALHMYVIHYYAVHAYTRANFEQFLFITLCEGPFCI